MKLLGRWKIALGLVLVFAAGAVTGSVLTTFAVKRAFERSVRFENWTDNTMAYLGRRLQFTEEQRPRVRVIVEEMGQQLKGEFARTMAESARIIARSGERLDQELTAEQRVLHARLRAEFWSEMKKNLNQEMPEAASDAAAGAP